MEDISEKLNQILSDPEQMSQIAALAQNLGSSPPQAEGNTLPFHIPPEQLQRVFSLLNKADGKEESLLKALRPFLSGEKAQKMSRAVQAARLSRIISQVLNEQHGGGVNV